VETTGCPFAPIPSCSFSKEENVKQNKLFSFMAFVMAFSMLLAACAPAATAQPTAAPKPTDAPKPTAPPVAAPFKSEKLAAPDCNYGGNLLSLETVDQYTVKFTFCNSEPSFLAKIALNAFGIMDADYIKAMGGDSAKITAKPIGTGPYIVKEFVRGDHITYVANPNYWGGALKNQTLIMKWNKESAARLLELQAGTVDGISDISADDLVTIAKDATLKATPRIVNNLLYLGINVDTPPWNNEAVRQGLAMAIDKDRLVKNFYPAGSVGAQQFVPSLVKPGYTDGLKWYTYDKAAAKKMLEDAKFDFTKEYELYYAERTRPYFPQPTKIATDLQAQLKEVGINIKLVLQEWATYLPNTRAGKTPLFLLGWSEDFPDATNWYDVFLTGTSQSFGAPFKDITDQIKVAATSGDPVVRQKAYDEVNKLFKQHVPNIPLVNGTPMLAFRADVGGVNLGPYNDNFQEMSTKSGQLVFAQGGEPPSLMCADETDGESFRQCDLIFDRLYNFQFGTATPIPALAEKCTGNADATVWSCTLKKGVKFSDGAAFDAADVFATLTMMWDTKNPYHVGRTGDFQYWPDFWGGGFLNPKPK
jgi:peptide/nickel transport system substrate-binding protein